MKQIYPAEPTVVRCSCNGQALFLLLLFMSLALAAVVTLSFIARRQVQIVSDIKESYRASAAADAGAEEALFQYWRNNVSGSGNTSATPTSVGTAGESYWYSYDFSAPTCPLGEGACRIEATGRLRDVQRTFRLDY